MANLFRKRPRGKADEGIVQAILQTEKNGQSVLINLNDDLVSTVRARYYQHLRMNHSRRMRSRLEGDVLFVWLERRSGGGMALVTVRRCDICERDIPEGIRKYTATISLAVNDWIDRPPVYRSEMDVCGQECLVRMMAEMIEACQSTFAIKGEVA